MKSPNFASSSSSPCRAKKTSSLRTILAVFMADIKPFLVGIGRIQFNKSIATEETKLGKTANFAMQKVP